MKRSHISNDHQRTFLSVSRDRWDIKTLQHSLSELFQVTSRACDIQIIEKGVVHCPRQCFVLRSPARSLFCSHYPLNLPSIFRTMTASHHQMTWHQIQPVTYSFLTCFPLLGVMPCVHASSLNQYALHEHPGSLAKFGLCLEKKMASGKEENKRGESADCKGNSLETRSGGLCFAVGS